MYFPYIKHTTQFLTINNKLFTNTIKTYVQSFLLQKKKKKISERKNKKHESPITMIPSTIMRHCINPF